MILDKMKVYVHIGFPRTGTTWLQEVLDKVDDTQIRYIAKNSRVYGSDFIEFVSALVDDTLTDEQMMVYKKSFNRGRRCPVFISEEGFLSPLDVFCKGGYKENVACRTIIDKFIYALKEIYADNYELVVVLTVRDQVEWLTSYYTIHYSKINEKLKTNNLEGFLKEVFDISQERSNKKYDIKFMIDSLHYDTFKNSLLLGNDNLSQVEIIHCKYFRDHIKFKKIMKELFDIDVTENNAKTRKIHVSQRVNGIRVNRTHRGYERLFRNLITQRGFYQNFLRYIIPNSLTKLFSSYIYKIDEVFSNIVYLIISKLNNEHGELDDLGRLENEIRNIYKDSNDKSQYVANKSTQLE